jgi:hypothetical protein
LDVYYNGSRLTPAEYTANNGTYITLATGSSAGDIIDMLVYSYQVGAFSGVGGGGVANQIAFYNTTSSITGSNSFVISGSNVGIGTTSPTRQLFVNDTAYFDNAGSGSTTNPSIAIGSTNVGVSYISGGALALLTGANTRQYITSAGLVGINTTNPTARFQIHGAPHSDYGTLCVFDTTTSAIGTGGVIALGGYKNNTSNEALFAQLIGAKENATLSNEAGYFAIKVNTGSAYTERLRISSTGNIGIGASGYTSTTLLIRATSATSTNWGLIVEDNASNQLFGVRNNGNVGIGTGSPVQKLQIDATSNDGIYLTSFLTTTGAADTGAVFAFALNDGSNNRDAAYIKGLKENSTVGNYASYMSFFTRPNGSSPTERIRLTSTGYLKQSYNGTYVSSTAAFNEFSNNQSGEPVITSTCYGSSISDAAIYFSSFEIDHNNTTAMYFRGRGGANTRIRIYSNGTIQNSTGTYGTLSSDIRLKENIVDASSKLEDIMRLRVVNFNFKQETKKQIGFIAQEFQEVFPSLVQVSDTREYDEEGNVIKGFEDSLGLNVGMEFAILVKALQEANAKITALEEKLERNNIQ